MKWTKSGWVLHRKGDKSTICQPDSKYPIVFTSRNACAKYKLAENLVGYHPLRVLVVTEVTEK